jgi:hypothetical protein
MENSADQVKEYRDKMISELRGNIINEENPIIKNILKKGHSIANDISIGDSGSIDEALRKATEGLQEINETIKKVVKKHNENKV